MKYLYEITDTAKRAYIEKMVLGINNVGPFFGIGSFFMSCIGVMLLYLASGIFRKSLEESEFFFTGLSLLTFIFGLFMTLSIVFYKSLKKDFILLKKDVRNGNLFIRKIYIKKIRVYSSGKNVHHTYRATEYSFEDGLIHSDDDIEIQGFDVNLQDTINKEGIYYKSVNSSGHKYSGIIPPYQPL